MGNGERGFIYDFGVQVPGGAEAVRAPLDDPRRGSGSWMHSRPPTSGDSEPDGFNALVMGADLDWRDVSLLRSIGRYLRQVGVTYSQSYFAQALSSNVDIARQPDPALPDPFRSQDRARRQGSDGERRASSSTRSRGRSTTWPALIMIESCGPSWR